MLRYGMLSQRKASGLAAIALLAASCAYVSFGRRVGTDEFVLRQEIKAFYVDVQKALAAGNPDALASLFSTPLQQEIRAWGEKFFAEHGNARLRIDKLGFDELGYLRAVVSLAYAVDTPGGKGDFRGAERQVLVKKRGRWYMESREKLIE